MTSKKSNWIFAAHAIETAYSYWKASEQLWPQFPNVAVINAALSIEIALKSFNVEVSGNKGKIDESYSFKSNLKGPQRHDLIKLYDILPDDLKCRLLDKSDLYYLDKLGAAEPQPKSNRIYSIKKYSSTPYKRSS
ncbi:MAG TPA: hypothetical protein VMW72_12060 [Sedimentisphaerales bacterium]|nr:hypothetical protein [Sedimentisphaerales bacterium]